MSYVMMMDQSISDVGQYSAYGEAYVGGEGSPWAPDIETGNNGSGASYGYLPWGGDVEGGGLDTGPVGFQLDADLATGVDVLTVAGSTISYNGGPSGTVGSVEVRVGADVPAQVSLQNTAVSFYQGGTLQETDSVSGLSVDTTDPSGPSVAEDVLIVTPNSQANDEVVVSGTMRMAAPDGTYPCPYDIFCQAYIQPPQSGGLLPAVSTARKTLP